MGRRRGNKGLIDVLVLLPWQVSAGFACAGFALMRWIIPSLFSGNPFLGALSALSQSLAWLPLIVFGFAGIVAFGRAKTRLTRSPLRRPDRSGQKFGSRPLTEPPPGKVGVEWGNRNPFDLLLGRDLKPASGPEKPLEGFSAWSLEALRALEWKRFELLCAKYYEAVGFQSKTIRCGADGGIDVKLFKIDPEKPLAIVQCKAWNVYSVGVKEVRELLGVMAHEKVTRGIFITTATYTKDALAFGSANPIQLLDGAGFTKKLQDLPVEQRDQLFKFAFEGDYKTPTCASCGVKMVKRVSKRGPLWGCVNYPRCKSMFTIKE